MRRPVAVVPHTHWDREWYSPFPAFQVRLVQLLDELLPRLESDLSSTPFLLDGQVALVDDYLEVRPQAAAALVRLAAAGRVSVGPWYVLMDEFCVSGETIVRNLQLGWRRASQFGGAMPVGYLPDMFGHIAQMPQLLAAAGMRHAVVWRGVPATVDRTAFWWRSPDGSLVRAEYLPVGYGNGASLPADADSLIRRLAAHEQEVSCLLAHPDDPILWMNGTDHQPPQPWLPRVVEDANRLQTDYHLAVVSLPEHLARAPVDGLPTWTGELRSGARANLLMGVLSNRVDVKTAAARAERSLERRAEPLAALWLAGPDRDLVREVLDRAWRQVILNSAHDSICACSADAVGVAVLGRFAAATAAAASVSDMALRAAARAVAGPGPVVVNASARTRGGVVELVVAGEDAPPGTQLLDKQEAGEVTLTGAGGDLGRLLGELAGAGWLPPAGGPVSAVLADSGGGLALELSADRRSTGPHPQTDPVIAEAWARAGAGRDRPLRVTARRPATARIVARVDPVPGYGWAAWAPGSDRPRPARAGSHWLDNGLLRVEVDATGGTFSLNGVAGMDRLVDGGDQGDTYNHSPPPGDHLVDRPVSVEVEVLETGPVRARLLVRRRYLWPARLVEGTRAGARNVEVRTRLEVRAGEEMVRVSTGFDNPCRDHRLRALFPLPAAASSSVAECAFATVTRGLEAEGGPHEQPLATFPSRRFVSAGGLTVTHEGLLEYELVDGGRALALTLLRATGWLSRPAPAWRPNPAGPQIPLEAPQMVGPVGLRYAVATGAGDPYALADDAWLPLEVVQAPGGGGLPPAGSLLAVAGAEVSALRPVAGGIELRVFNPSPSPTTVRVEGGHGWLVDLLGRPLEPFEESFPLGPWKIATAVVAAAGSGLRRADPLRWPTP